jgi:hypothetical protein
VLDFQGLIAEDGQLYVIDPQGVDLHSSSRRNSTQLNALQGVKQNILLRLILSRLITSTVSNSKL